MNIGTRSLLFGVHQFLWHPLTVGRAWRALVGRWPSWREWICIFLHDVGYWGKPNIDGPEGRRHPEVGAKLVGKLLGPAWAEFTILHSREYAKILGKKPSLLCWADKYSIQFDPIWFYIFRSIASEEVEEFMQNAPAPFHSERAWLDWYRKKVFTHPEILKLLCSPSSISAPCPSCSLPRPLPPPLPLKR